jgi:hypothetical protein
MKQLTVKNLITVSSALIGAAAVIVMFLAATMNLMEFGCVIAPEAVFIHPETGAIEHVFVHRSVRAGDNIVVGYNRCGNEYVHYQSEKNPTGKCESAEDLMLVKIEKRR